MSQDIYPPGTSTVTVSGVVDTELPTAAALADNAANPTAPLVGSCLMVWDGATWDRWGGAVSASGTFDAAGPDAHDAAVSGNPVLMAGYASAAAPAAVSADGDVCRLWVSRTGVLQVGDGGGSITVDNGGTFAVQAAQSGTWGVRLYDSGGVAVATTTGTPTGIENALVTKNIPSGTQTVSIAAGSNAIGKLAANSGVDIGDVDVTSVVPGTGATNLGKAEDAAHTSGDVGVMALAVYKTSATLLVGSDGDYTPLTVDASGQARVVVGNISSLATLADGTSNPNTGGVAAFQMIWNGSTWDRAPGATATGLLVNTELPAAAALADSTSNPTAPAVGAFNLLWNGSTWDRAPGSASAGLTVNTELPAAAALADNLANPTAPMVGAATLYWDATQWKRVPYTEGTVYSSAARTATPSAVLISNPVGCKYLHIWMDRTAGGGGSGIALELYANHIASGVNRRIWVDSALTASGAAVYHWAFGPGLSSTAGAGSYDANMRGHVPLHVPVSFYVVMSHLDATSNTYSLYYSLTP